MQELESLRWPQFTVPSGNEVRAASTTEWTWLAPNDVQQRAQLRPIST
jgi:hypothetical protein